MRGILRIAAGLGFLAQALAPCAAAERPSLILITIDTLRADHVNVTTAPALSALAAESLNFTNAVTVSPLTLPAHASLLTGLNPYQHGIRDNNLFTLPRTVPTFTAALKAQGYATGAFVSSIVLDRRFGLGAGFNVYEDTQEEIERTSAQTLSGARKWLASTRQPVFLWIHLFEPHAPYLSGSYAGEVRIADRELARFFDFLRKSGLWDRSLLCVTSDHGEALGEHGEQTHGFFLYDETVRIPWILRVPGKPGRAFRHQVRITDILPTMLEYAGLPRIPGTAGVSLVPFVEAGKPPDLTVYSETFLPRYQFTWSELKSLRTGTHKYIEAPQAELYNIAKDPGEKSNILAQSSAVAPALRAQLAEMQKGAAESRPAPADPNLVDRFKSLGYIGYSPSTISAPGGKLPDPKSKLEIYLLAMSALELSEGGKPAEALEQLRRAETLDPGVTQVHYLRGSILGGMGRYAEAIPALQQTVKLNPRFTSARFKPALAYLRTGDTVRAEGALQEVAREEPRNYRAMHNLAAIAYSQGNFERAEELEKRALGIDPDYFKAWNTPGAIYIHQKRTDEAVAALKKATRLNPKSGQAFYNLSLAYRQAGDASSAQEAASRACGLDKRYCGGK